MNKQNIFFTVLLPSCRRDLFSEVPPQKAFWWMDYLLWDPVGLVPCGLCVWMGAFIRPQHVRYKACFVSTTVHHKCIRNCYIRKLSKPLRYPLFAHFLSNRYGRTIRTFRSPLPTARMYCLINYGFKTSVPCCLCLQGMNDTSISPLHNHDPITFISKFPFANFSDFTNGHVFYSDSVCLQHWPHCV